MRPLPQPRRSINPRAKAACPRVHQID